jgi:hypothetical protein
MAGWLVVAASGQPEDVTEGPRLRLMFTAWMSDEVRQEAVAEGWVPIPLMVHRFHYNPDEDAFDGQRYADRIWWPEWTRPDFVPGTFDPDGRNWEKLGIPDDDSPSAYTGWADLDFERYSPVWYPEDHPSDEITRIALSYVNLALVTRQLRPSAKVILHGLVNRTGSETGRGIIEEIASYYDAVSPSIYPRFTEGFTNLPQQLNLFRDRLQFCAELRATLGIKIFPIVWKRYHPLDHGETNPATGEPWGIVMPPDVARAVLEVVADHDPDGIIVFGPDGRNHWRVDPSWPPDTPTAEDVDRTTRSWLKLIADVFRD